MEKPNIEVLFLTISWLCIHQTIAWQQIGRQPEDLAGHGNTINAALKCFIASAWFKNIYLSLTTK